MLLVNSLKNLMGNTVIGNEMVKPLWTVYSVLFHWVEGGGREDCKRGFASVLEHFSLPYVKCASFNFTVYIYVYTYETWMTYETYVCHTRVAKFSIYNILAQVLRQNVFCDICSQSVPCFALHPCICSLSIWFVTNRSWGAFAWYWHSF